MGPLWMGTIGFIYFASEAWMSINCLVRFICAETREIYLRQDLMNDH